MSRKKRKPAKKAAKRSAGSRHGPEKTPSLPDWRAIEGQMWSLLPGLGGRATADTPLDRAQEIMYEAFEAGGAKQLALAKRALEVCPDCADAYVVLAEHAGTLEEALRLNEEGVAAGQRALGKEAFKEWVGRFWGVLETRPYMRARLALAQCLWSAGSHDQATAHYQEMLRLNPNDNQGVRYLLSVCLMDLDRRRELKQLLSQYESDAAAHWAYNRALLAFREEGDSRRARQLLLEAKRKNSHVPVYLVGNKPLPAKMPQYVGFGDDEEAVSYAVDGLTGWKNTPGAITWLRKVLKVPLPEPPRGDSSWGRLKAQLARLDQAADEVWQVDIRQIECSGEESRKGSQPWGIFVTLPAEDEILGMEFDDSRPTANDAWECLAEAMQRPNFGSPRRPAEIHVRLKSLNTSLGGKLDQIGVACRLCAELDHVDYLIAAGLPGLNVSRFASEDPPAGSHGAAELCELPQHAGETWQADARRLGTWIEEKGAPYRPWGVLVANRTDDLILGQQVSDKKPPPRAFAEEVLRAIHSPLVGEPHRPGTIELLSAEYAEALEPLLGPAGVQCVVREELDQVDFLFGELGKHLAGPDAMPALVQVPGVDARQVGGFFAAAAEFYRRTPWRKVPGDTPIEVRCGKFESGPWYAFVMGQSGMTLGLALHEDRRILELLHDPAAKEEEVFRSSSAISLTFGEAFEISPTDLDAAEKHGWPVAGPEAYPCAIRVNPGRAVRPPLAWELELLEGCLRAMPEFVARKDKSASVTVPTASGGLTLDLARLEGF